MPKGYNGKVLFVDLTSGSISEEKLQEKLYRDFIGGQGLGVRILYERMEPKADPLGPDNILGFVVGPLTGVGIHGDRYTLVGKSPLTGGWGDSNSGGSLAKELKSAGYDGVFFSGMSSKPVYLYLNDGKAEVKDASHLWGRDTVETGEMIRNEVGDQLVKVACIGPSGEAQSLLAAVMHEGSAAARSGLAAVMGSKLLKAFAVRGTNTVPVANPERLSALRKDYLKSVRDSNHPALPFFRNWGICGWTSPLIKAGDAPIKNWTLYGEEGFPNHAKISGDSVIKYQVKRHACLNCPLGCKGWVTVENGPYAVTRAAKPEYETLALMGSNLLIEDVEAIIKANDLCNRCGMDTIGVGSAIGFAMECYERGIITKNDTNGIELTWGNAAALVTMVEKICRRDGFGAVLADGASKAAERIGEGSEEWAIHIGGQDLPAHDPRCTVGYCWGYYTDSTPGRHTTSFVDHCHYDTNGEGKYVLADELQLPVADMNSLDIDAQMQIHATCSDADRLWTSLGLCIFALYPETMPLMDIISAVTGWDYTISEGLKTGRRIKALRQAFNIREGVNTSEWRLPKRVAVPAPSGPIKGKKLDFSALKERGYAALGWDAKGKPLDLTLRELGLKELVGDLP